MEEDKTEATARGAVEVGGVDFCDLNAICEAVARVGGELAELPCDENCPVVKEGIVVELVHVPEGKCTSCGLKLRKAKGLNDISFCPRCRRLYSSAPCEGARWAVSEHGMANFVGRQIGNNWAQPMNDAFHLGEKNQRDLYYSAEPSLQFFKSHNNKNVSLIVGNSNAEIPDGWKGQLAYFNELFYYKNRELHMAPNICGRLLPKAGAGLRRGKMRVIHERRDAWLRFLVSLLLKSFDPKDFYKGKIRQGVVCDWFRRNIPGAPASPKTYKRDYELFRTYHGKPKERDYRESAIILTLKQAADPQFSRRRETAEALTGLLVQLKAGEEQYGHPIEISSRWQYTGDKHGTRTLVALSVATDPGEALDLQEAQEAEEAAAAQVAATA